MPTVQDFSSALARIRALGAASIPGGSGRARLELVDGSSILAARELAEGVYRIGAKADCDLVIPDAKIAHIATLKVEKGASGLWAVTIAPFIEGMTLNGAPVIAFNPVMVTEPATLVAGPSTIRIIPRNNRTAAAAREAIGSIGSLGAAGGFEKAVRKATGGRAPAGVATAPPAGKSSGGLARSFLLVAGLLFLAALASSFWDVMKGPSAGRSGETTVADGPRIEDQADLVQTLRKQLQVADLGDHIKVRAEGKTVVLEGAVTDRQEERYRSLLNSMRRRTTVDLRSNVRPVALPAQMEIAAVALEPTPYIVLADGNRYQIGDTLPQGWQVEIVSPKNVVLSRSGLRETISLDAR